MGSIAYVADEEMIEYHRLCGNKEINFWRLSNQKKFTNFHKGDLLFFYTRSSYANKKGFAGYAHFDSTRRMSIQEMWKRYKTGNGYDSIDKLSEAIQKACRDKPVPVKMDCLYLTDVVFFRDVVYPEEIGLEISPQLESYCYIDKNNPSITVKLLRQAEQVGIDVWSSAYSKETEAIFQKDEIRQGLSSIAKKLGRVEYTQSEMNKATRLVKKQLLEHGYELIKGSLTDCFCLHDHQVEIAMPFIHLSKNKAERMVALIGRMSLYRYYMKEENMPISSCQFRVLMLEPDEEIMHLQEVYNNEKL